MSRTAREIQRHTKIEEGHGRKSSGTQLTSMEENPHSVQIPLETESDTCPTRPNRKHSSTETHSEPTAKHLQRQRKQSRDGARTSEICPLASFRFGRVRTESVRHLQRQRLPWKGGATTTPRSNRHATDATAVAMNHKYADAKFENIQREMCGKRVGYRANHKAIGTATEILILRILTL